MCDRYANFTPEKIYQRFNVADKSDPLVPRYNVTSGMSQPVVIRHNFNIVRFMQWGLVPSWSKNQKGGLKTTIIKSEGILEKPDFLKSLRRYRCLIPANGFYAWKALNYQDTAPYYFHLRTQELFAFAGLYDIWEDNSGEKLYTYAIITATANRLVRPVFDRMPVIISKESESYWLNTAAVDMEKLVTLLKPYPAKDMSFYSIDKKINSPKNDYPDLIRPIS